MLRKSKRLRSSRGADIIRNKGTNYSQKSFGSTLVALFSLEVIFCYRWILSLPALQTLLGRIGRCLWKDTYVWVVKIRIFTS